MSQPQDYYTAQVVIPGQLLAESSSSGGRGGDDSFISGHGTYIVEQQQQQQQHDSSTTATTTNATTLQLRASICGTIQRINKLISVESIALYHYAPNVGDLIIGRVRTIQNDKWILDLCNNITGTLPLSSVHLPGKGSIQRKRTANDVLEMRQYIKEGDLVSCEVHKVHGGNHSTNNIMLHTRSIRYGKLENGSFITVPPKLILRRKTHYTTIIGNQFQILIGCNGMIWIQRNNNPTTAGSAEPSSLLTLDNNNNDATNAKSSNRSDRNPDNDDDDDVEKDSKMNSRGNSSTMILGPEELAEAEEVRRMTHSETPYTTTDRQNLARIRNSIEILRSTLSYITPELVTRIYHRSCTYPPTGHHIANMLQPEHILKLTSPPP
jgi:exosome complex RNA-binding protein Rrp4